MERNSTGSGRLKMFRKLPQVFHIDYVLQLMKKAY
jgi:hypothetical protein